MIKNFLIHGKYNKIFFLNFNIKLPSKKEIGISETRKILSFKKTKNRLLQQKLLMQFYWNKIFIHTYEQEKLNTIENLLINKVSWKIFKKSLKSLASINVIELKEFLQLKNRQKKNQEFFKDWILNNIFNLKSQWIQNKELKILGFTEIINAYNHLINIIKKTITTTSIHHINNEEIKSLKTNFNLNKIYLDQIISHRFQELTPKIYAPLRLLKNKMKIWKLLSKNGTPKACGRSLIYYYIIFIKIKKIFFLF